jgi:hypothetical protein
MEKLTKKQENKYWLNCSYDEQDAIQQLGKLEDLQDELGIPLEVLFKALKEGVYIIDGCEIIHLNHTEISLHHNGVQWLWETPYGAKIFTHYKITWALTREKLENAED